MFSRHRDAVVAHHRLEDVLVHAERRGEHARRRRRGHRRARAAPARCRPRRTARAAPGRRRRRRRASSRPRAAAGAPELRPGSARTSSRVSRPGSASDRSGRSARARPRCRSRPSASTTLAAEASEIAFSLERPPRIDGDPAGHGASSSWSSSSVPSPPAAPPVQLADVDRSRPRRPSRRLRAPDPARCTIPSWLGSVTGSVIDRHRQARPAAGSSSRRPGCWPVTSGHLRRRRPLRDRERDLRALRDARAGRRVAATTTPAFGWSDCDVDCG